MCFDPGVYVDTLVHYKLCPEYLQETNKQLQTSSKFLRNFNRCIQVSRKLCRMFAAVCCVCPSAVAGVLAVAMPAAWSSHVGPNAYQWRQVKHVGYVGGLLLRYAALRCAATLLLLAAQLLLRLRGESLKDQTG